MDDDIFTLARDRGAVAAVGVTFIIARNIFITEYDPGTIAALLLEVRDMLYQP